MTLQSTLPRTLLSAFPKASGRDAALSVATRGTQRCAPSALQGGSRRGGLKEGASNSPLQDRSQGGLGRFSRSPDASFLKVPEGS
eukprot:1178581-Prorocentrum_minimum.AAC.3